MEAEIMEENEYNPTGVNTEFKVEHNQSNCYGYNLKKGVYLKHLTRGIIVMCLGHEWDSDFFKGIIVCVYGNTPDSSKFTESNRSYCEAGDIFETFKRNEFTLFEGEITIKQYSK